jgi:hypothetical protein
MTDQDSPDGNLIAMILTMEGELSLIALPHLLEEAIISASAFFAFISTWSFSFA